MHYRTTDVNNSPKIRKTDRILVLTAIDNTKPKKAYGLVDLRSTNRLHAIQDTATRLWYLKYEDGGLPAPLKQKFTRFDMLLKHAQNYFQSRNVTVKEVID